MQIEYPVTIENYGERLSFLEIIKEKDGDKVIVEASTTPGNGPAMHTHLLQDESLTVEVGKMGYQILGGEEKFIGPGETVLFKRGVPHKFWNAGDSELKMKGWIKPADNIAFFLSGVYQAQNKTGGPKPEMFDASYLLTRYSKEYDMPEIPGFVKKVIMPITVFIGKLLGKYKHFEGAPAPIKG